MRDLAFNREICLGGRKLGQTAPIFIIAEAGVNHGGNLASARELIEIAQDAGADAVKFQFFKANELIVPGVEKAPYQLETTGSGETQYEMLRKLELSIEQTANLQSICKQIGITFLTTPFDEVSLAELDRLDMPAYKIASTDITNLPYLRRVAQKGKPMLLSTGMAYQAEVDLALTEIHPFNRDVVLLQCTANYPIQDDEANLAVLDTFRESYDILLGYSDHTQGIGAAPFAIPFGVKVIEKHFTLDKSLAGPDHRASLDPDEFKAFVTMVRRVETYLGSAIKMPNLSELQTRKALQKAMVASRDIAQGEILTENNLKAMRTGGKGISPAYYHNIMGQKTRQAFRKGDIIEL
ncbi:N-acetylneuraminate synthase family protein [Geothrix sp. 21YS21S-4]|uniref:N-acetylneuraminate synthase family protein n=1 Tax=Geothrix sp. 21YS21S-4 TaxID=3068889 RepID=UPI0027BA2FB8|nr:N-acetylneuraminate synthase family protein [Geothrix sp. 21YS21S-4]